jgi:GxxExxY protein
MLEARVVITRGKLSSEFVVPVQYKDFDTETELRCDLLIEDAIVVELKSVDEIAPIHEAQILTYMKLLNKPKGILINFNCVNLLKKANVHL